MKTALLLVAAQRTNLIGGRPVPAAATVLPALESLLDRARSAGAFVVHIQNDGGPGDPAEPFTDGWELMFQAWETEIVLRTTVDDAFSDGVLGIALDQQDVARVVVAGAPSERSVDATVRGALDHGLDVVLAAGAHAAYDQGARSASAVATAVEADLAWVGVQVEPAEEIAFDL